MVKYKVTLDVKRLSGYELPLEVKQGDQGSRYVYATLVEDGVPIDLENTIVTFYALKRDGYRVFNKTDTVDGEVVFELTSQVLAAKGTVACELVVYSQDGYKLASATFFLDVIESVNDDEAIESTNEFTQLTEVMTELAELVSDVTTNEDIRESNEAERKQNEAERQSSEEEREDNEFTRQSNESIRESREEHREANNEVVEGWIANPEQFKGEQGEQGPKGDKGDPGSIDNLTGGAVEEALGYVPADVQVVGDIQSDFESLLTIGQSYPVPLVNGWTGELWYRLNDLHQVYIYGHVTSGDMTSGGIVAEFPDEFSFYSIVPLVTYSSGRGESVIGFYISTQKTLIIRHPVAGRDSVSGVRVSTLLPLRRL